MTTCKFDWTSLPVGAVLSLSVTPGTSGLHSVQGEGLAFAHRVETQGDDIRSRTAKDNQIEDGRDQINAPGATAQTADPEVRGDHCAAPEDLWLATAHGKGGDIRAAQGGERRRSNGN